jgi:hypothetical protein
MSCHAGRLPDPVGTVASVRAEAAVSLTQGFSANSENRPISVVVTRKLIGFSVRCSGCRILIHLGGMRSRAARATQTPGIRRQNSNDFCPLKLRAEDLFSQFRGAGGSLQLWAIRAGCSRCVERVRAVICFMRPCLVPEAFCLDRGAIARVSPGRHKIWRVRDLLAAWRRRDGRGLSC